MSCILKYGTLTLLRMWGFLGILCNIRNIAPLEQFLVFISEGLVHDTINYWVYHCAQLTQKRVHDINLARKVPASLTKPDEIHDGNWRPTDHKSAHGEEQGFRDVDVLDGDVHCGWLVASASHALQPFIVLFQGFENVIVAEREHDHGNGNEGVPQQGVKVDFDDLEAEELPRVINVTVIGTQIRQRLDQREKPNPRDHPPRVFSGEDLLVVLRADDQKVPIHGDQG